jgi:hypothetical protein
MEIELMDGVKLVIDPAKFDVKNVLKLQLPEGDLKLTFDVTITDVLEQDESKVQGIVGLRSV